MKRRRSVQQPELGLEDRPPTRRRKRLTLAEEFIARALPPVSEEYTFASMLGRQWRFDFCWPAYRVAYEYEGATWTRGRHVQGSGVDKDIEKYNRAQILGWLVVRGTASTERSGAAFTDIADALRARGWRPPA